MLLNYQQKQSASRKIDVNSESIFLIHGLFGSLSNLAGLANALQEEHQVISVDLRNHGNSPHSADMSYQEMANDLFALANHLHIDNFSIAGHSMGGKVAMVCALQQPQRINKLLVADIAPVAYPDKHRQVFSALAALQQQEIKSRKAADLLLSNYLQNTDVRQFLLKSLKKQGDTYQLQFNLAAIQENYQAIRSGLAIDGVFTKETLFIKGANSDYIQAQDQDAILQLFPNAQIKMIANTGHWLHAEKPKIFNRLACQFFF